jgi:ABC-type multidrug transport system fused ATPase/permease subunit
MVLKMPYLICDKCEIYYEIDPNFDLNTLQTCEKCSEDLKYYENFDEYYKEKDPNPVYEEADSYNDYIENKNLDYHTISTIGFILAVIGLLVFVLAYVSPFFLIPQNLDNFQNSSNISNFFIQIILIYAISIILMVAGVLIYLKNCLKVILS